MKITQKQRLLDHLQAGWTITRLQSWQQLGILECPARISELRSEGYAITTTMKTVLNRYQEHVRIAVWSMEEPF